MKYRMRIILAVVVVAIIAGASVFGYNAWYNSVHYVSTDNARVVADLIQVGSINPGKILAMNVDVGSPVIEGQVLAIVDIPTVISKSDTTGTPKLGFRDVVDQFAEVVAPRSGVIAARWAQNGDTVPAGRPIVTLMDPRALRIEASISESSIDRVRPGQRVEVHVDSLGRDVAGTVVTISPVTASTFSLIPARSSSSNFNKVSQLVPVKISLDEDQLGLIPGSSVQIKIRVK